MCTVMRLQMGQGEEFKQGTDILAIFCTKIFSWNNDLPAFFSSRNPFQFQILKLENVILEKLTLENISVIFTFLFRFVLWNIVTWFFGILWHCDIVLWNIVTWERLCDIVLWNIVTWQRLCDTLCVQKLIFSSLSGVSHSASSGLSVIVTLEISTPMGRLAWKRIINSPA